MQMVHASLCVCMVWSGHVQYDFYASNFEEIEGAYCFWLISDFFMVMLNCACSKVLNQILKLLKIQLSPNLMPQACLLEAHGWVSCKILYNSVILQQDEQSNKTMKWATFHN